MIATTDKIEKPRHEVFCYNEVDGMERYVWELRKLGHESKCCEKSVFLISRTAQWFTN